MVKDHSDRERGNLLPPHEATISGFLYAPSHRQDNTYHNLCYTSRGTLAGKIMFCGYIFFLTINLLVENSPTKNREDVIIILVFCFVCLFIYLFIFIYLYF